MILWVLVILLVVGGGYFFLKNQSSDKTNKESIVESTQTSPAVAEEEKSMTEENTVIVSPAGFMPKAVTVKVGTRVVWTNKSGEMTNVSSAMHPTHLVYPPLNLGDFEDGKSVSLVFAKPGTYKYHNHLNPSRFGTVVVE